nr:gustatory receptor 6 [Podabrus annulatus]
MTSKKKVFTISPYAVTRKAKKGKSVHQCLKWVLVIAQCLGQMPVTGVTNPDPKYLKFTWKSCRLFYCVIYCICVTLINMVYIQIVLINGINFFLSTAVVFHSSTLIITLMFLKLSTEWSKIMRKWSLTEYSMRSYGHPPYLYRRINIMAGIVLSIALTEYTLVKISKLIVSINCKGSTELFEFYSTRNLYPELFNSLGYSLWLAIPLQIINIQLTFAWTFNDLFIMLVSTAVAVRFQQVTSRLKNLKEKDSSIEFWREIREDYNSLCKLTHNLNDSLSYIILISFASNLYFILVQLFNSMRIIRDTIEKVYFFFSFGFLILRIVCVTLYGAWIYDESKEPMFILNSISTEFYNIEIKRFIDQIKYDTVALTGKKFFYVTRGLILSVR